MLSFTQCGIPTIISTLSEGALNSLSRGQNSRSFSVSRGKRTRAGHKTEIKANEREKQINKLVVRAILHADLAQSGYLVNLDTATDTTQLLKSSVDNQLTTSYLESQRLHSKLTSVLASSIPPRNNHLSPFLIHARHHSTSAKLSDSRYFPAQVLDTLRKKADSEPYNVGAQCEYLRIMLDREPHVVIKRVDSGLFAVNQQIIQFYKEARARAPGKQTGQKLKHKWFRTKANPDVTYFDVIKTWIRLAFFGGVLLLFVPGYLNSSGKTGGLFGGGEVDFEVSMPTVTFDDVAGNANAVSEMNDLVTFLTEPEIFTDMGCKIPKGFLLSGSPGVGKTLLARALAGEAAVPFFYASGSQFEEVWVGMGASRVRKMFADAKAKAPSIIFIDEIDSIGYTRSSRGMGYSNRGTLNQILSEMDGFEDNSGVIVLAATNDPDSLDKALTREGRFDTKIAIRKPNCKERFEIMKIHARDKILDPGTDLESLATACIGMTGAQLATLVNSAALRAVHLNKEAIDQGDLEYARAKILIGPIDIDREIPEVELENTAAHEAGHAIIHMLRSDILKESLYVATIEPRNNTLGHVQPVHDADTYSEDNAQLIAQIDVAFGGRVAEELLSNFVENKVTTGCSSDMKSATRVAEYLIRDNGYSDKIGYIRYSGSESKNSLSDELIHGEIKKLFDERYKIVKADLKKHEKQWKRLTEHLLKYKTLTGTEVKTIFEGGSLSRTPDAGIPST